jgi:hypothetical protein
MAETNTYVTSITDKQPTPSARFTIICAVEGYPVQVECEGNADKLRAIIARLTAIGAVPPQVAQAEMKPVKTPPLCPAHGTPMKPSRKPGSYFCPRRDDMGEYCPHKA